MKALEDTWVQVFIILGWGSPAMHGQASGKKSSVGLTGRNVPFLV